MSEKRAETNLIDYLNWRGDLTLAQDPFNEVDSLLLSVLSYINFSRLPELRSKSEADAVPIGSVCRQLTAQDEQQGLSIHDYIPVMQQAAATERFRELRMLGYESIHDEALEMQFAAVSFLIPDGSVYLSYMGTDRTLVGWKEDCNMSFMDAVPAQLRAAAYAGEIAAGCPARMLRLGGHSKGGNLAVWAACHLPEALQPRLLAAYNNDGPGFCTDLLSSQAYRAVEDRVLTIIPESSIIGVLLEHEDDYEVIASSNHAVMQHEALSWQVMGNRFVRLAKRSQMGKVSDGALRDWLNAMSPEERQSFIDALFQVLSQGGRLHKLEELWDGGVIGGVNLVREYAEADDETKSVLREQLRNLVAEVGEELLHTAGEGMASIRQRIWEHLPDWLKREQ